MLGSIPIIKNATVTPSIFVEEESTQVGAVYDEAGRLIQESVRPSRGQIPVSETLPAVQDPMILDAAIYAGHMLDHFGHFLTETIPSFYWANLQAEQIIFHPSRGYNRKRLLRKPFIYPILEALEIDVGRIVIADHPIRVETLLLPDRRNAITHGIIPIVETLSVYGRIREAFGGGGDDKFIYLTRREFYRERRRVDNEEEIERIFAEHGFRVIAPEKLSIQEQVTAVGGAQIIAGQTGSALHLSGFMRAGTTVLALGRTMPNLVTINDALNIRTILLDVVKDTIDPVATRAWLSDNGFTASQS